MAYQSLYRRYRPQRFGEVRGQDHLVRALRTAVAEDRVGHAYLLSGPRGTGKTTTARILAKALNCEHLVDGEPCGECPSCEAIATGRSFDLQELDAASNRGIGEMKDLLDTTALGTPGRTKVYILDEVHMLTPQASAALLKTLEEPPGHVVFVLATTDPQKVLPTIRSRTQHFQLHLLPADQLRALIDEVAADAGLELAPDQIEYALRKGGGSARDTLSALDEVVAAGTAPESADALDRVLDALVEGDPAGALAGVQEAIGAGREPRVIGENLLEQLRDGFLVAMRVEVPHLTDDASRRAAALGERLGPRSITRALEVIGEALVEMRQAADPRIPLEVALLRITRPEVDDTIAALQDRVDRLERRLAEGVPGPSAPATSTAAAPTANDTASASKSVAGSSRRSSRPSTDTAPDRGSDDAASPARGARPADEARQVLAAMPSDAPSPAVPRGRPALGAHRGQGTVATSSPTTDPAEPPAVADAAPPATPAPHEPAPAAEGPAAAPAPAGAPPTRDELTLAWGESVLAGLIQRTRSRWSSGRFVEVIDGTAHYGLPNKVTCDRCEEGRPEVEAALAARFGRPVPVRLVVDTTSAPPPDALDASALTRPGDDTEPGDEAELGAPVEELADAGSVASGLDLITGAFPGAQVIDAVEDPA